MSNKQGDALTDFSGVVERIFLLVERVQRNRDELCGDYYHIPSTAGDHHVRGDAGSGFRRRRCAHNKEIVIVITGGGEIGGSRRVCGGYLDGAGQGNEGTPLAASTARAATSKPQQREQCTLGPLMVCDGSNAH